MYLTRNLAFRIGCSTDCGRQIQGKRSPLGNFIEMVYPGVLISVVLSPLFRTTILEPYLYNSHIKPSHFGNPVAFGQIRARGTQVNWFQYFQLLSCNKRAYPLALDGWRFAGWWLVGVSWNCIYNNDYWHFSSINSITEFVDSNTIHWDIIYIQKLRQD